MEVPFDRVVWNSEEAASYLKESTEQFLRKTRHSIGFPAPLSGSTKSFTWRAIAVSNWKLGIKEAA